MNIFRLRVHLIGLAMGLSAALLGMTSQGKLLEETKSLEWLFQFRGVQTPPPQVVIVPIERDSSIKLVAPDDPTQWSRHLHASAVQLLHHAGAELIAFDIFFGSPHPSEDENLAQAMAKAGNVVLADYLKLRSLQGDVVAETLEQPQMLLTEKALGTAPFLLAQGAEVSRFLTLHGETGEQPTLPTLLFQLYLAKTHQTELADLLREAGLAFDPKAPLSQFPFVELVHFLARQEKLQTPIPSESALLRHLNTLTNIYVADKTLNFNHYGPVGSISRISYHDLLLAPSDLSFDLRGKIVLIGFAEDFEANSSEGVFDSPFSPISSLELAATALANLLDDSAPRPLFDGSMRFLWLMLWGYGLGLLSQLRSSLLGMGSIVVAGGVYLIGASVLFTQQGIWVPLVLPLIWQTLLSLICHLVGNYLRKSRVAERAVPRGQDERDRLTFGISLATDAGQYSTLAEKMEPMALGALMNRYYSTLFPAVTRNKGWISDVVGDSMMAIWTGSAADLELRRRALLAALQMSRSITEFEAAHGISLPLRIGLQCGEMRVGFVGASDRGEYRAVGDTVNTASRLEGLNKLLGTRILASATLMAGVDGFVSRPLGSFLLAGRAQAVQVEEPMALAVEADEKMLDLLKHFQRSLELFQGRAWEAAVKSFQALALRHPHDGPTQFYLKLSLARASGQEAGAADSVVRTEKPILAYPLDYPAQSL